MFAPLKITFALAALAFTAGPLTPTPLSADRAAFHGLEPELVTVAAGTLRYRPAGEFTRAGRPLNTPFVMLRMRPLTIMRRQVTAGEYGACVAEGACPSVAASDATLPVVKVSWRDATAYAAWVSYKTGKKFRLPTDDEWAFAAGSRWRDDALPEGDPNDPAKGWIARYEAEAARDNPTDRDVRPLGAFGVNENGLADLAGNIWEWTDTCYRRVQLDESGRETGVPNVNCGVRVVAGRHRTYMTDFVRDPRSGGCAFGIPPANLGFRLVRETEKWLDLWS
jgi:formylglycine-generating enzyme required for sulfatase activity